MSKFKSFSLRYEVRDENISDFATIGTELASIAEQGEVLKVDVAAIVIRTIYRGQDLIIKRYTARGRWHSIKRAMRRSRAKNAWMASFAYTEAGIAVPEPIMYLEHRLGPIRLDSFFVYRAVEGESLLEYLPQASGPKQAKLVAQLGSIFRALRASRLVHGDMKASNLLVVDGHVVIIDLDVARRRDFCFGTAHARDQKRILRNWVSNEALSEELAGQISE